MKIEQSIFPINARQMRHYHEKPISCQSGADVALT